MSSTNMTAGHIGREYTTPEKFLGRKWTFGRWTRAVWVAFAEWARETLPDPLTVAMKAIEQATLRDAEILRELSRRDADELAKAGKENRPPVLVLEKWKPISDTLIDKAQELANCYLDFNSRQFRSLLTSPPGASYAMYLLLREKQPDVTPDVAYDLLMALGQDEITKVFAQVQGSTGGGPEAKNDESPAAPAPRAA